MRPRCYPAVLLQNLSTHLRSRQQTNDEEASPAYQRCRLDDNLIRNADLPSHGQNGRLLGDLNDSLDNLLVLQKRQPVVCRSDVALIVNYVSPAPWKEPTRAHRTDLTFVMTG